MSLGRAIFREVARWERANARGERRKAVYKHLQSEAASRPGSVHVQTPAWEGWMSPIEHALYEAMRRQGLDPIPQFGIQGYFADFAFPDVRLAVEADGAAYHGEDRRERDRWRDSNLRRAGWTVKRFRGSTIHQKPDNCAFVVKREVEGRRREIQERARQEAMRRQARRDALLRPFRKAAQFLMRWR